MTDQLNTPKARTGARYPDISPKRPSESLVRWVTEINPDIPGSEFVQTPPTVTSQEEANGSNPPAPGGTFTPVANPPSTSRGGSSGGI